MCPVPRPCARRLKTSYLHNIQVTEPRMESNIRDAHYRHTQPALGRRLLGQGPVWQGLLGRIRSLGGRDIRKRPNNTRGTCRKFELAMFTELTARGSLTGTRSSQSGKAKSPASSPALSSSNSPYMIPETPPRHTNMCSQSLVRFVVLTVRCSIAAT